MLPCLSLLCATNCGRSAGRCNKKTLDLRLTLTCHVSRVTCPSLGGGDAEGRRHGVDGVGDGQALPDPLPLAEDCEHNDQVQHFDQQ